MDRRKFLKSGVATIGGMALFNLSGQMSILANNKASLESDFTIEVLTGNVDRAVELISGIIPKILGRTVNFSEHTLPGKYVGDVVYVHNNALINFRQNTDEISRMLTKISKELKLPSNISNPKLLVFSAKNENITPKNVNLFVDNKLVERFDITENVNGHLIKTNTGEMALAIENNSAKIISSSCRHKTCIHTGTINQPGQNIVCIPNRVRLSIEGSRRDGVDAVSQ